MALRRPLVGRIGSLGEGLASMALGVAFMAVHVFLFSHVALLVIGVIQIVLGSVIAARELRLGAAHRAQDRAVRALWGTARRLAPGYVVRDPVTGNAYQVERNRGFLALVMIDAAQVGQPKDLATVTRYRIGHGALHVPPPVLHDICPYGEEDYILRWPWPVGGRLEALNRDLGGAMETSTDELQRLNLELTRATEAAF